MSETPLVGDRTFRDQVVQISALTVNTVELREYTFSNCRILGPAIVIPLGRTEMGHCTWNGSIDAIFWEISEGRNHVIGAVALVDCVFSNCVFQEIGFAGPLALREAIERATQ